jgi:hypothetical protein
MVEVLHLTPQSDLGEDLVVVDIRMRKHGLEEGLEVADIEVLMEIVGVLTSQVVDLEVVDIRTS